MADERAISNQQTGFRGPDHGVHFRAPVLSRDGRGISPQKLPASYVEFISMWAAEEPNASSIGPDDIAVDDDAATKEVSAELTEAAQAIVGLELRAGP